MLPNFWFLNAVPGATFDTPTTMAFLPDGRLLVGEKQGRVWMVKDGTRLPTPVWQSQDEILDEGDKGLLCVAVDPNFASNRLVYFLYTVDPDTNGVDDNILAFSRLTRYQMSATGDTDVVDPASRAILFGRVWGEGPTIGSITHSIGALRWGADGSLLVTAGDGAEYTQMDPGGLQPDMFGPGKANPNEDIGAFRAQDITSLDGKVLRINPRSGAGYPSNPFWNGDSMSVRSRVWEYGLRNPFRFTVRANGMTNPALGKPGTLYIGDVGWETWEEIDIATQGGRNFGWPCWEGKHSNTPYQQASPAHNGCGSTGTATNPSAFTLPVADWNHFTANSSSPSGVKGNSSIGGAFYTGVNFPVTWRGRYFFGDYGYSWIRTATVDANDNVTAWADFAQEMDGPVDFAVGPWDGDLYYIAILTGEVRRIHYYPPQPGNVSPTAVANVSPSSGSAPLTVSFSSAGSSDPNGDSLRTIWDFGDGSGSFLPNPVHTYQIGGTYTASLMVDDNHLGDNTVTRTVTVTDPVPNSPPVATITSPLDSTFVVAGDSLHMVASATDAEQSSASLTYNWVIDLHHNNHIHPSTFVATGAVASYDVEQHDDGTGIWYEVKLRVTDQGSLADTVVVHVFPEVDLSPADLAVYPDTAVSGAANTFAFTIHNLGRMPAPYTHWALRADNALIAEGDTLVAALGDLPMRFDAPVQLAPGDYTLRVTLDSLRTLVETNETNNVMMRPLHVRSYVTGVGDRPRMLRLSAPMPNPARDAVRFALELPARARVDVRVLDIQGRQVWAEPARAYEPGRWTVAWDARNRSGAAVPSGIYLAQVRVDDQTFVRRIAVMR
jgi:glucose/arabinose dehydrogenase